MTFLTVLLHVAGDVEGEIDYADFADFCTGPMLSMSSSGMLMDAFRKLAGPLISNGGGKATSWWRADSSSLVLPMAPAAGGSGGRLGQGSFSEGGRAAASAAEVDDSQVCGTTCLLRANMCRSLVTIAFKAFPSHSQNYLHNSRPSFVHRSKGKKDACILQSTHALKSHVRCYALRFSAVFDVLDGLSNQQHLPVSRMIATSLCAALQSLPHFNFKYREGTNP